MQKTRVVNVKKEDCDVYIGRAMPGFVASPFQNIFRSGVDGTRAEVIEMYRVYIQKKLARDPILRAELEKMRGKRIGWWCKPRACHGDVLAELLDGPAEPTAPEAPVQGSLF